MDHSLNLTLKTFAVACTWSQWTVWGSCSVTSGCGTQGRTRTISVPAENGGAECTGDASDQQSCCSPSKPCAVPNL